MTRPETAQTDGPLNKRFGHFGNFESFKAIRCLFTCVVNW